MYARAALALAIALAGCGKPAAPGVESTTPRRARVALRPRPAIALPPPPTIDDLVLPRAIGARPPPRAPTIRRRFVRADHPIARGDRAFSVGNYYEARELYAAVSDVDRDADYAWYRIAWCDVLRGQPSLGRDPATKALRRTTDHALAAAIVSELLPRVLAALVAGDAIDELRRLGGGHDELKMLAHEYLAVGRDGDVSAVLAILDPEKVSCATHAWQLDIATRSWPPVDVPRMNVVLCERGVYLFLDAIGRWHDFARADVQRVPGLMRALDWVVRRARVALSNDEATRIERWAGLARSLALWDHARHPARWAWIASGFFAAVETSTEVPQEIAARAVLDAWFNARASGWITLAQRDLARHHGAVIYDVLKWPEARALALYPDVDCAPGKLGWCVPPPRPTRGPASP